MSPRRFFAWVRIYRRRDKRLRLESFADAVTAARGDEKAVRNHQGLLQRPD